MKLQKVNLFAIIVLTIRKRNTLISLFSNVNYKILLKTFNGMQQIFNKNNSQQFALPKLHSISNRFLPHAGINIPPVPPNDVIPCRILIKIPWNQVRACRQRKYQHSKRRKYLVLFYCFSRQGFMLLPSSARKRVLPSIDYAIKQCSCVALCVKDFE